MIAGFQYAYEELDFHWDMKDKRSIQYIVGLESLVAFIGTVVTGDGATSGAVISGERVGIIGSSGASFAASSSRVGHSRYRST